MTPMNNADYLIRLQHADGNHRVIIKFDGKLLPYAKKGQYPW